MYLDTSVVIAYYCPELLSQAAERVIRRDPEPAISDVVEVEFFSAVARKVRAREMSGSDAARSGGQFAAHLQEGLYARVAIQRRHYETARDWLAGMALPLRALDALHLAVANEERLRLVTSDRDMFRSARALDLAATLVEA
jgi:predicted nucleic acid-binding protein